MKQMRIKKQRGMASLSLLGVLAIGFSIVGLNGLIEYGNVKMLDRQLDHYARDIAQMSLRYELALTQTVMANNPKTPTEMASDILKTAKWYTSSDDQNAKNIEVEITFGNFDQNGNFEALDHDADHPRAAEGDLINFSAVAVQLWSEEKRFWDLPNGYVPQGKALFGLDKASQDADSECYCKNRYSACLNQDLVAADLIGVPSTQAEAIAVKNSQARQDYCNYGFTASKPGAADQTKYPYVEFSDPWIGRPPQTVNFLFFYQQSYDGEEFERILTHKPVNVPDGNDPLKNTSGWSTMFSSFFCFFGCSSADLKAQQQDQNVLEKSDLASSIQSSYTCEKPGFMMFPTTYPTCNNANTSNDVVLDNSVYVGYQGTCVVDTDKNNVSMSRCLAYNDSATPRFESCLEIERRSALHMNFFQRMMAFFFGPFLDWERSYEGLDCEMQKMRYRGWMFWGGWKDV